MLVAMGAANPAAALGAFLADASLAALAKPEVKGFAEVYTGGAMPVRVQIPRDNRDSFAWSWANPPTWARVQFNAGTRLRVHLIDEDLMFDDPIGDAEIGHRVLLAALKSEKIYQVKVDDQTQGQILFLGVSVVAVD
ncbi:hypothetical protein [Gemmatimonas sp.]|uniref:hypothetical protein n=1 Tax=Gemmatimonas sp. TaxID=1962908 RepID=UPI00398358F4